MITFPNQEQNQLIKEFIILPFVLRVFERDLKVIEQSPLKTKEPYVEALNRIVDKIIKDISTTKRELQSIGIYVYSQNQNESSTDYQFKFKGYHHRGGFSWNIIRNEVQQYMKRYLCNNKS